MIDETNGTSERVGFCQDCGRALTRETVRTVGSGTFCEPCLEIRLAAAAASTAGAPGAVPPPPGTVPPPPGAIPPGSFPPLSGDNPSPKLAAVLGLIPGVGAMYNGQFAKGIAHIVIFAVLDMIADHGPLGILVAGWIFYQAFEAYHTAKARLEGLPLPDPFGLNDIGDRFGFGKGWGGSTAGVPPTPYPGATPPPYSAYPGWTGYTPPIVTPPPAPGDVPPAEQAWGSTAAVQGSPAGAPFDYRAPYVPPAQAPPAAAVWGTPVSDAAPPPVRASRVPAGAIWLIGLGILFLIGTVEPDWRFQVGKIVPFVLMGLGAWIFARRMSVLSRVPESDEEVREPISALAVSSLRGPLLLVIGGILLALQAFNVVRFGRTWPVLVIALGVSLLLERSVGIRRAEAHAAKRAGEGV
jgi:TM2 domain-containing membrane protein YozV